MKTPKFPKKLYEINIVEQKFPGSPGSSKSSENTSVSTKDSVDTKPITIPSIVDTPKKPTEEDFRNFMKKNKMESIIERFSPITYTGYDTLGNFYFWNGTTYYRAGSIER